MALIRIQEYAEQAGVFQAKISFNQGLDYDITIHNPFSKEEEERLEWYFEEHLKNPFMNQVKAEEAAISITEYGEKLFAQVFSIKPPIRLDYEMAVQKGLNTLQIEIVGEPSFHALHWEALKDPVLPQPLALQATIVRKNSTPQVFPIVVRSSPTINLLIVTARPRGKRDMGYRTISEPLVEVLRQADISVQVDVLRPSSYKALKMHLHKITGNQGVGYYHVIHFDVHGSLLTYEEFRIMSRFMGTQRDDRQIMSPYEGLRAFLALEGEQDGMADLVGAEELADLLMKHQIPIAMLNACQSGKQVGDRETSLGGYLMQAGVQMVVAMTYSVTVSAAKSLMRTLYKQLFAGCDLSTAACYARQELYHYKSRKAYFDQQIELEDWLLPVVYQSQLQHLSVRAFTLEERKAYDERQGTRYTPPQPDYGFVGRDLDILQIEKRLLNKRNILLVQGMGGVGKTTLLQHLGTWWQTTGFIDQVFYFGYDERVWTQQQILSALAQRVLDPERYAQEFQPLSLDAQQSKLAQLLRVQRHLLILDNLESITEAQLGIQLTLPYNEQEILRTFLTDLVGGHTFVLLGSRGDEAWLAKRTFGDNVFNLRGLDPEAASILTDRILERHNATKYRENEDLQRLLDLLDGFPLALGVILSNLTRQTPAEILSALQAGDATIEIGDSQEKTENILVCIGYSYNNLTLEKQKLLLFLAPFTSVIWQQALSVYVTRLQEQPLLTDLPLVRLPEIVREAKDWGLLASDPFLSSFFHIQPTLPYFLRNRPGYCQLEMRRAVETAFVQYYEDLSEQLNTLLESAKPTEQRTGLAIVRLEYENLMTALDLALTGLGSTILLWTVLFNYLNIRQEHDNGQKLAYKVLSKLEADPDSRLTVSFGLDERLLILDALAHHQHRLEWYTEAEVSYHKQLSLLLEGKNFEEAVVRQMTASIYHNLGRLAHDQRQWDQAEQYYQQALQIWIDLNVLPEKARTYDMLGDLARDQRQWDQAEQYYQQALQIWIDLNVLPEKAMTLSGLGTLAQEQRRSNQAEYYYQQALQIYVYLNDSYGQASAYQGLGIAAQGKQLWGQAEQYFQRELQIRIEFNDRIGQLTPYHHLGMVTERQGQWSQAEQYYQKALDLCIDFNDRYRQARAYHQLGCVALHRQQWDKAEHYFQLALQIKVELDERYDQGSTYTNLGTVAYACKQWDKAEYCFQQALQIYFDFDDQHSRAAPCYHLGLVAKRKKEWGKARSFLLQALEIFMTYQNTGLRDACLSSLAQVWQVTGDTSLPAAIASIMNINQDEATIALNDRLKSAGDEKRTMN